jgi:hypothetical protein
MLLRILAFTAVLFSASVGSAASFDVNDPPQGEFQNDWFAVMLEGKKTGYMNSVVSRQGDLITTTTDMKISMSRAGTVIPMTIQSQTVETVKGEPRKTKSSVKMATSAMEFEAVIKGDRVTVTQSQFGAKQSNTYDFPQSAKLPWGIYLEEHAKGLKPGVKYSIDTYDPMLKVDGVINTEIEMIDFETIDLFGRKVRALRSSQTVIFGGNRLTSVAHLDENNGTPLRLVMPVAGLNFEMLLCEKVVALEMADPPEMFISSLIPVDRFMDRDRLNLVKYKLSTKKEGTELPDLPITSMQTVQRKGRDLLLSVRRVDAKKLQSVKLTKNAPEDVEYLNPSVFLNADDDLIQKLAKEARGKETAPYKVADRLRQYVSGYVTAKDLNVGFATASEVARSREGDCTEHGVLLAALGRASGLPARVVSGIIYVPDFRKHNDVFGFHMWTQFKIGDQWIDFDAAQHQTICDPTHIALTVSPLNDDGLGTVSMSLLNIIGNLNIEILETKP